MAEETATTRTRLVPQATKTRLTPGEEQTKRIEQALNRVAWDVEDAIADLRDTVGQTTGVDWIPALLHEAEGILLDGNDPGLWLMKELKRRAHG